MTAELELIPGVRIGALGLPERVALSTFRLLIAGRGSCPTLQWLLCDTLGSHGPVAFSGLSVVASRLPVESCRPITIACPCTRGITWDESAVLALIAAAQRADAPAIATWLTRLGVISPTGELQRGLSWSAVAFSVEGFVLNPEVGNLGLARPTPAPNATTL